MSYLIDLDGAKYATLRSWNEPYVGNAPEILYKHIEKQMQESNYARFLTMVQSPGTGKSRMIDELSRTHFVILINLRRARTGFPPCDRAVLGFLSPDFFTPETALIHAQAS